MALHTHAYDEGRGPTHAYDGSLHELWLMLFSEFAARPGAEVKICKAGRAVRNKREREKVFMNTRENNYAFRVVRVAHPRFFSWSFELATFLVRMHARIT